MVRTRLTARKSTGSQIRIAPSYPIPSSPIEEEDPEETHFFVELEDGRIMERDADGNLVTPRASPEPEEHAPNAAASGDPDDSGNDDDDGDEEDNNVNANNNDANANANPDNNDVNQADNNQGDDGTRETVENITSVDEPGFFPVLLQDVLEELNNMVKPLYVTNHFSKPGIDDLYSTRVHIREHLENGEGYKTISAHDSPAPHDTYAASVSDAAKRALWSLCYTRREELSNTIFRHLPRRASGTETTIVPLGEGGEDPLNVLCHVTAALNTELEGATTELSTTRVQLRDAQDRIAQLEAQLAGQEPPPEENEPLILAVSPPRKRLRYGAAGSRTRVGR